MKSAMTDATTLRILGISGSLRNGSYNTSLLLAAGALAPDGVEFVTFPLGDIPMYNADLEAAGDPEPVSRLKREIAAADGLLLATPEYNYSVSGALKNALDWASRPPRSSALHHKPIAIMGVGGRMGTVRAQMHLREILLHSDARVLTRPEVYVSRGAEKFDSQGKLIDEPTRQQLLKLMRAFKEWMLQWRVQLAH
jgi:chromate reductase